MVMSQLRKLAVVVGTLSLAAGCDIITGLQEAQFDPTLCAGPGHAVQCPKDGGGGGEGGALPACVGKGCPSWAHIWGDDATQEPVAVALQTDGGAVVVGAFSGTMQFDAKHQIKGDGERDGFIVRLTPEGSISWALDISGSGKQIVSAVSVVDEKGNLQIGGYTQSTAVIGGLSIPPGMFVLDVSQDGTPARVTPLGGGEGSEIRGVGSIVYGAFVGSLNIEGGAQATATGSHTNGFLVWTYGGEVVNSKILGGDDVSVCGAATDIQGNIYVSGSFAGDFGALHSPGGTDVFLVRYSFTDLHWMDLSKRFGDASDQKCTSMVVDAANNVLVGGQFAGVIDFDGNKLTAPSAGAALFAASYAVDVNGVATLNWSKGFAEGTGEVHLATDALANVVLAGGFLGTLDLGGDAVTTNAGSDHGMFVAKVDKSGNKLWLRGYASPGEKSARAVAVGATGESVVVGIADGYLDMGPKRLHAAGAWDALAARFAP
jgi:hypothetical protein